MAFDPQGQDDLYEVLGLTHGATADEVDAAYHRLLNGLTGTTASTPAATEGLRRRRIRLANAYSVLADPPMRAAYDARMGLGAPVPATAPVPAPSYEEPPPAASIPVAPAQPAPVSVPSAPATQPGADVAPATPLPDDTTLAEADAVDDVEALDGYDSELEVADSTADQEPGEAADTAASSEWGAADGDDEAAASLESEEVGEDEAYGATTSLDADEVDDDPAPWETPAAVVPVAAPRLAGPPRPPVRRPAAAPSAPMRPAAPAPRTAGGMNLPSRKVALATPLPDGRVRPLADLTPAPLPVYAEEEEEETPYAPPRPVAAARARPRPQAVARPRPKKVDRSKLYQTLFYGFMAMVLIIGTFASLFSSVIGGTTGTAATAVPGTNSLVVQADAALAAGKYQQAIDLYNAARSNGLDKDAHLLLGLAKAYVQKSPPEPDIARQFLGEYFAAAGNTSGSPEYKEAINLLSSIGLPTTLPSSPTTGGAPGPAQPATTNGPTTGAPTTGPAGTPVPR